MQNFVLIPICLFSSTHLQVRPLRGFLHTIAHMTWSHARCAFWGLKDFKLIFNVVIPKIRKKITMVPLEKIKHLFKRS